MKSFLVKLIVLLVVVGSGVIFIKFYSYIFARTVNGVIFDVEKPTAPIAVMGSGSGTENAQMIQKQLFSYSVAIQLSDGEIITASTEDRQWAVAEKGKCVEAKFFPYPPWQFDKSGTYFGARLLKMFECEQK